MDDADAPVEDGPPAGEPAGAPPASPMLSPAHSTGGSVGESPAPAAAAAALASPARSTHSSAVAESPVADSMFGSPARPASAARSARGEAMSPLGAAPGDTRPLTLKLLARRGMALCQLSRYADAKTDYERALAIDPGNAQLQKDLQTIDAMLGK